MNEIIYILRNEAMPDYIKIGRTNDINRRVKDLDWTNIPLPFECYYAAKVKDVNFIEQQIFQIFADQRVRSNREFFRVNPERVIAAIKMVEIEEVTPKMKIPEIPGVKEELEKIRKYKKRFDFEEVGIPIGAELTLTRDKNIKANVAKNSNVEINGEIKSLSKAAQDVLGTSYPLQGPIFWMYEDETLDDRRKRIRNEEE